MSPISPFLISRLIHNDVSRTSYIILTSALVTYDIIVCMSAENPGRPDNGGSRNGGDGPQRPKSQGDREAKGPLFAKRVGSEGAGEARRESFKTERSARIARIVERDTQAFRDWKETGDNSLSLDLPADVAQYLIPPRLLELAEDPTAVSVKVDDAFTDPGNISLFIVERRPGTDNFQAAVDAGLIDDDTVESGVLEPEDYVHNTVAMERHGPNDDAYLHVFGYVDREENRGKGVATSFYARLREFARESGFTAVTGEGNGRNVGYFTEKLGRTRLTDLPPEEQQKYAATVDDNPEYFTIDDLRPQSS